MFPNESGCEQAVWKFVNLAGKYFAWWGVQGGRLSLACCLPAVMGFELVRHTQCVPHRAGSNGRVGHAWGPLSASSFCKCTLCPFGTPLTACKESCKHVQGRTNRKGLWHSVQIQNQKGTRNRNFMQYRLDDCHLIVPLWKISVCQTEWYFIK